VNTAKFAPGLDRVGNGSDAEMKGSSRVAHPRATANNRRATSLALEATLTLKPTISSKAGNFFASFHYDGRQQGGGAFPTGGAAPMASVAGQTRRMGESHRISLRLAVLERPSALRDGRYERTVPSFARDTS